MSINRNRLIIKLGVLLSLMSLTSISYATHSWNGYHWARTAAPFYLQVAESLTDDWNESFDGSVDLWSQSGKLVLISTPGNDSDRERKRCNAITGQLRVCNASYGYNGWLGMASIYIDSNSHITKGTAKMNDSYAEYWTMLGEKNHVMCQEIGHVLGLGHTTENGTSQKTCMDYSSDKDSQWPNFHDMEQLNTIYGHLDGYNSYDMGVTDGSSGGGCTAPAGKGCNKNNAAEPAPVPMGVLVHRGSHHEIRVAPGKDGGLWIHNIRLVHE